MSAVIYNGLFSGLVKVDLVWLVTTNLNFRSGLL